MHRTSTSHINLRQWIGKLLLPVIILLFGLFSTLVSTPHTGMAQVVPTIPGPGQISGVVFDDLNGNGTRDVGEPGIANVTVTRVSGPAVTTDSNGNYTFTNVAPGSHTVNVTIPAGYMAGGETSRTVTVVSGSTTEVNFSLLAQGTIAGVVFEDRNGNGILDAGEPGIAGVTVNRSSGSSTTTDANGAYRFTSVTPGNYTISIVIPASYAAGGVTSQNVSISSGGAASASFALVARGVIQGVVFNDLNGNGTHDGGEPGIANVTITRNDGQSVQTDANGGYRFTSVAPGSYTVNMTVPANHVARGDTSKTVTVGSGGSAQANFALLVQGVIQGSVFEDLNGNMVKDNGEFGLAGVTITRSNGQSTTTDANGNYQFTSVAPGEYTIAVNIPAGYIASGLSSKTVNIRSGGSAQVNFALRALGVIQGVVYEDRNGNKEQDGNEPGIGGVVITRNDGVTAVTSSNGTYRFNNVTPGSYSVAAAVPVGYVASSSTNQTVNVGNGGSAQANFTFLAQGVIQGVLFHDLNTNGYQDSGEPGLSGITVSIADGTSQVSDAQGGYRFTGVVPGDYTVKIALPTEYIANNGTARTVHVSSGGSAQASFAIATKGTIYGVVFADLNGNNLQDSDESGIAGVVVTRSDGATQTTDSAGIYKFSNVTPGSYTLVVAVPANYIASDKTSETVYISAGGAAAASFAMIQKGVLQGAVYEDRNGNGRQDQGEPGIGGITVTRSDGATATTNSTGGYRFEGTAPGSYTVAISVPDSFVAGAATSQIVNVAAGSSAQANFGLLTKGVIQGVVFDDFNGNGTQDSGEPGIGGIALTIEGGASTVTDNNGGYQFNNVVQGSYKVQLTVPPGYVAAGPDSRTVIIGSAGSSQANFALRAQGVIQGVVYEDRNGNGYQDDDEPGVGGVAITQNGTPVGTTNGSGGYRLDNVNPGSYTIAITVPDGYVAGEETTRYVGMDSGSSVQANFVVLAQGVIQGVVFDDYNGNKEQDGNEPGISGVAVTLGNQTINTNAKGSYRFDQVTPGNYTVEIAVPTGYTAGGPTSHPVAMTSGSATQVNFALQAQSEIRGVVFDDRNGNGTQEPGEPGISGVTILRVGGPSTQTDTHGGYRFTNVPTGNYTLQMTVPAGYVAPRGNLISVPVNNENIAQANFSLQETGALQGIVFHDKNNNGEQDKGEAGISGVTVIGPKGTTQTLLDGSYRFADVGAGTHSVQVELPANYSLTSKNPLVVSVPNGGSGQANFGLNTSASGTINGYVFQDSNSNGAQDGRESGLGGVTVDIYVVNGSNTTQHVGSTQSAGDGSFRFTQLTANQHYIVRVTPPAGFTNWSAGEDVHTNQQGNGTTAPRFPLLRSNTLSGYVFVDRNANNYFDITEQGLGGITVALQTASGTSVASTKTTADGRYEFTDVLPQNFEGSQQYRVTVNGNVGSNYDLLSDDPALVWIYSHYPASYDFVAQLKGTIAGSAIPGTQLTISSVAAQAQSSAPQADTILIVPASGEFSLDDLPPGDYQITQTPPQGFYADQKVVSISLSGDRSAQAVFDAQPANSIAGIAFDDLNGNGVRDDGEALLGGVVITLRRGDNTVRTTTTNGQGQYQFLNLTLGNYTVVETDPSGYTSNTPNTVNVTLNASNPVAIVNFGDQLGSSITGTVFRDDNFNGRRDAGEEIIPQVTVELLPADGNAAVASTLTLLTGDFSFRAIANGTYRVRVAKLEGHNLTTPSTVTVSISNETSSAVVNFGQTTNQKQLHMPFVTNEP